MCGFLLAPSGGNALRLGVIFAARTEISCLNFFPFSFACLNLSSFWNSEYIVLSEQKITHSLQATIDRHSFLLIEVTCMRIAKQNLKVPSKGTFIQTEAGVIHDNMMAWMYGVISGTKELNTT